MVTPIKFGTDGWRAVIAEDYTFDNVRLCAQSVADYLKAMGSAGHGLVVGYDTRFASGEFAAAVAEVAAGNGIVAYLADRPAPTPTVSYSILPRRAAGAVMITASHNPPMWNGFKYKPEYAGSAPPWITAELEKGIERLQKGEGGVQRLPLDEGLKQGLIKRFDPSASYLAHLGALVDLKALKDAGLAVVYDAMYGTGAGYLQTLLSGGRIKIVAINQERNPAFPGIRQPEPIADNLERLMEQVPAVGAQVGLATDGDADRVGVVDEKGRFVTQLEVFALLALYLLEVRGWRGPIVKSLSTTSMIDRLGQVYNVPVYETPVGFKYIGPKMVESDAILGGEESGGFGFRHHIPERDGVLAGLFIMDMMVKLGRTPSELVAYLFEKVGPHLYNRIDIHFPAESRSNIVERLDKVQPKEIDGVPVAQIITVDGYKYCLTDGSWLLIRFSGTEPLLRIYGEADSPEKVERLLNAGRELVGL